MYYVLYTMYYVPCTMYYVICTMYSVLSGSLLCMHRGLFAIVMSRAAKKHVRVVFLWTNAWCCNLESSVQAMLERMTYVSPVAEMRSAVCCRTETVPGDLAVLEPWQHVCITIRTLVPTIACRCCQRRMTPNANTIASASIRFWQWLEQFKEHSATLQVTIQDTFKSKPCGEIWVASNFHELTFVSEDHKASVASPTVPPCSKQNARKYGVSRPRETSLCL